MSSGKRVLPVNWLNILGRLVQQRSLSYLNPKMEKTTIPANKEVMQLAMEIVMASRSVFS